MVLCALAASMLSFVPLPGRSAPAVVRPSLPITVRARAAIDPFADPVFSVATGANQVTQGSVGSGGVETYVVGIAGYVVGMIILTLWDEHVLPKLQERNILPTIPDSAEELCSLRAKVIELPWVTPLTADRSLPLPSLEELTRRAHRVGTATLDSGQQVVQYIRAHAVSPRAERDGAERVVLMEPAPPFKAQPVPIRARWEGDVSITSELGVCCLSPDFTKHYGHNVYICKQLP